MLVRPNASGVKLYLAAGDNRTILTMRFIKISGVKTMNKTELIAAVAEKAEISKKDADSAVNAVIESIIEAVASKDKVQIVGFGTFEARERKEKIGKNPRTGEEIKIAASVVPAFKAGKAFKDATNK